MTEEMIKEKRLKSLLIWGVPLELKQAFKSKCAGKTKTMRDVIIAFMENYVND